MGHQASHQYPSYKFIKWTRHAIKWRAQAREVGAAYVLVLLAVMVMGIGLVAVSEVWHTTLKREKEQELLFIGNQYRQAIGQYYAQTSGQAQRYPVQLEDLLKDPRFPGTKRYLRKIFPDPMTREGKWGLVRGPSGGIVGVHSLSDEQPIKKTNFRLADKYFEGMTRYSNWVFIHGAGKVAVPPPKQGVQ
ncbi:MAG: type II secretion system protein [Gallionella sp.]